MRAFLDFLRAFTLMFLRNRQALFWTFFFPVLLMGLLGIVFGRGFGGDFNLAIVKLDDGMVANVMVQAFKNADGVTVSEPGHRGGGARQQLQDGTVQGVLVLPPDLQRSFARGRGTTVGCRSTTTTPTWRPPARWWASPSRSSSRSATASPRCSPSSASSRWA